MKKKVSVLLLIVITLFTAQHASSKYYEIPIRGEWDQKGVRSLPVYPIASYDGEALYISFEEPITDILICLYRGNVLIYQEIVTATTVGYVLEIPLSGEGTYGLEMKHNKGNLYGEFIIDETID